MTFNVLLRLQVQFTWIISSVKYYLSIYYLTFAAHLRYTLGHTCKTKDFLPVAWVQTSHKNIVVEAERYCKYGRGSRGGRSGSWNVLWLTARCKALLAGIRQRRERLLPQAWCRFWQHGPAFPPRPAWVIPSWSQIICAHKHTSGPQPINLVKINTWKSHKMKSGARRRWITLKHSQD